MIKAIEPQNWSKFLTEFSVRNRNRRARFEIFGQRGTVGEEEQEAHFESATIENNVILIMRIDKSGNEDRMMADKFTDIRGISVQYDTDGSENILEFTDSR